MNETNDWRQKWAEKKVKIAQQLERGECGGSYPEAVLILCAAISAMAAEIWPGEQIDRKRFVEVIKEACVSEPKALNISVPLLIQFLRISNKTNEANTLQKQFVPFCDGLILTCDMVDRTENEIFKICPNLSTRETRRCCYPSVLYTEVRSGYVHRYKPGNRSASFPMTSKSNVMVSYVNRTDPASHERRWLIYFHIEWLSNMAKMVAKLVDLIADNISKKRPTKWYVDG